MQARCLNELIISSDIGNNCAIGNAYPTFEKGRKYLAPGLFGPCGYGPPAILGAKIGCPDVPVVGFAGDGAFGISMNEMTACGRNDWPPITMVIFRNYQWGAEKRNTTLWYSDNTAVQEQMIDGVMTFIEVVLNQELGDPFRRDAMTAPVEVAGIDAADMRPQAFS